MFFLARKADGIAALCRFADSYREHPAGLPHDLIVLFKGFERQGDVRRVKEMLAGIDYRGIELPDAGFDIGAYFEGAKRVSNRYLVFLNTHSQIVAHDWLAALSRYGLEDQVGVSAAMGSYESLYDTVQILSNVMWRCTGVGRGYDRNVAYYFDFLLRRNHPRWYSTTGSVVHPRQRRARYLRKLATRAAQFVSRRWITFRGTALIWPGAPRFDVYPFPRFPNPHVRSNAFMIRRDRWLQFDFQPSKKSDTSLFESGPRSLTAQLRASGLAAMVVGKDGKGYEVADWPRSRTFRLGDQANLLIHDNHTRAFEAMSDGARMAHAWMTWGDYVSALPADFPDLGYSLTQMPT